VSSSKHQTSGLLNLTKLIVKVRSPF